MTLIEIESVNHLIEMSKKHKICYSNGNQFDKRQISNSRLSELNNLIKNNRLYAEAL